MTRYTSIPEQSIIITEEHIAAHSFMQDGDNNDNYDVLSEAIDTRHQAICDLKKTNLDDELSREFGYDDFQSFIDNTTMIQRDGFWIEYHIQVDEIVNQLREVK